MLNRKLKMSIFSLWVVEIVHLITNAMKKHKFATSLVRFTPNEMFYFAL
jgi:hypothetical protein